MRPKSNRGGLPNPDSLGRWRPEVGVDHEGTRVRFQVGNKRDTTEAEALKRLNANSCPFGRVGNHLPLQFLPCTYPCQWTQGLRAAFALGFKRQGVRGFIGGLGAALVEVGSR